MMIYAVIMFVIFIGGILFFLKKKSNSSDEEQPVSDLPPGMRHGVASREGNSRNFEVLLSHSKPSPVAQMRLLKSNESKEGNTFAEFSNIVLGLGKYIIQIDQQIMEQTTLSVAMGNANLAKLILEGRAIYGVLKERLNSASAHKHNDFMLKKIVKQNIQIRKNSMTSLSHEGVLEDMSWDSFVKWYGIFEAEAKDFLSAKSIKKSNS